jgi:hypothetical protein
MWQKKIIPTLENVTRTFTESMNYFSIINERNPRSKSCLREIHIENGQITLDQIKQTRFENLHWDEAIADLNFGRDASQSYPFAVS